MATMSNNPPEAASSSDYQVIFDNSLNAYKKKVGRDPASDPLLCRLETCDSPDSVLTLLRQQVPGFDQSESSDERLTNWVNPAVNVLYTFSATIGGAVSLGYPPAGVIFTGIASLLSAVFAVNAIQSALVDLFERIENFFRRLGMYVELPPTAEMTDIIVKVMVEVLLILAIVTKEVKQGKIKRFLKKLVGRSYVEDALRRLDKLTQEEARMAAAQGLRAAHGVGERVMSIGNDLQDVSGGVKAAVNKMDSVLDGGENMRGEIQQVARGVNDLAKDANDDKRNQLRQGLENWLSPPDPFINLNTADQARHEGTTKWFTQSSVFTKWKESSSLLWIYGKPGSGKTVLTSAIIQDINSACDSASGHMAFFLFDFKDTGKQDARALLSSLIVQLSNQSDYFYNVLLRFYTAKPRGKQQPSIGALIQCLEDMLRVAEELPIYLIIDALDECPNSTGMPSSREQVLALVERLVKLGLPNLRLCITSRPETDIRTSFEPLTSNSISLHDASGQRKDIVDFVRSVVTSDKNMRTWREEDKRLVIESLSDKADGMFRWVFCQLETLRHCFPSSVRRILAELPETLDETYERILRGIHKTKQAHAHRLLQCLTVAVRPLAVGELAEVIAIDFDAAGGIPKLNEDFRWADQEQAVLSACSSLVAIVNDWGSRRVQFSHFSVKEFLTSDRLATSSEDVLRNHYICLEPAHTIMAQACLGVLLRLDNHMDKETIESYPLAQYAGDCFVDHVKFEGVLSHINDGLDYLLDQDKPHFNTWFWLQYGDFAESNESKFKRPIPKYPPRVSPLFYALALRQSWLAQHLILRHPHDLDARDIYGKTALHIAIHVQDCKVAQMFIERTAAINVQDNRGWTPLHHAMYSNKYESNDNFYPCVRLLLDCGANVEAQDNQGSTPLHLAASAMSRETVQLLIENSTNTNLRDDKGRTALHKALQRGRLNIIRLILKHADVDAQDNDGSTPLHLAIFEENLEAVKLILKRGANVNLRNNEGRAALHEVLQRGHLDAKQPVLDHDTEAFGLDNDGLPDLLGSWDLDRGGRHWLTPPNQANSKKKSYEESLEVVQLLLEHGANIALWNDMGQTALHKALQCGGLDIMLLILNHGADMDASVDAQDKDGSTPLHLAISEASLEAVQLLLRHGSNVNLQDNMGQTALHRASQRGHLDIIRLVLIRGADVNALDKGGSTPLHLAIPEAGPVLKIWTMSEDDQCAISEGSTEAMQLLLKHGANINLQNSVGQTALHQASQRGHLDIMQFILNHGADVDAVDNDGSTPLHLAISEEKPGAVQLLLKHGASVHKQNNLGETPF